MDFSILSGSPLFAGLTTDEVEKVIKGTPHQIRKFMAGSLIAQSGDHLTSLMLVLTGTTKGEMTDYTGRVIKIEDIPAPNTLASAFLFGNKNQFPVNVVAISDTTIMKIEKNDFLKLLRDNDRILTNFLDMISNRSQFLSEKIKFLNFKTIRGKLAQFILQRTTSDKVSFRLAMNQADLADYFGIARPSLARALKELEDERMIEATGKIIRVIDRKKLADLTSVGS
jgi:CRP/FNR family transcriptional regulator, dissimilatory nitrate respiration regulator